MRNRARWLTDTIAGVSTLTGLSGFVLAANGELRFTPVFAAHATVLGLYAAIIHLASDTPVSVTTLVSISPLLGVATVVLPLRVRLVVVSLLLTAGGIALSLVTTETRSPNGIPE